jgi:hypothetical protein
MQILHITNEIITIIIYEKIDLILEYCVYTLLINI